jgi:hypothetical protein
MSTIEKQLERANARQNALLREICQMYVALKQLAEARCPWCADHTPFCTHGSGDHVHGPRELCQARDIVQTFHLEWLIASNAGDPLDGCMRIMQAGLASIVLAKKEENT